MKRFILASALSAAFMLAGGQVFAQTATTGGSLKSGGSLKASGTATTSGTATAGTSTAPATTSTTTTAPATTAPATTAPATTAPTTTAPATTAPATTAPTTTEGGTGTTAVKSSGDATLETNAAAGGGSGGIKSFIVLAPGADVEVAKKEATALSTKMAYWAVFGFRFYHVQHFDTKFVGKYDNNFYRSPGGDSMWLRGNEPLIYYGKNERAVTDAELKSAARMQASLDKTMAEWKAAGVLNAGEPTESEANGKKMVSVDVNVNAFDFGKWEDQKIVTKKIGRAHV